MERPDRRSDSAVPPDPAPGSDPEPTPRHPQPQRGGREASPDTLANNTQKTPLDPDENIKDGIEVNET